MAIGESVWVLSTTPLEPASRVETSLPEGTTPGDFLAVSPDGRKLVVAAAGQGGRWVRELGSLEWRRLPGTENGASPFWSPDSRYVAFAVENQLKRVDTTGGPPETLCTVSSSAVGSGSWNRDGEIIFGSWGGGSGGPLWRVSRAGGAATAVTEVDTSKGERYHTWPTFLEDGRHFLYFRSGPPESVGIYAGSLDATPTDQSHVRILATELTPSYANGYIFFMRATTMMAQPFDHRRLQLKDAPVAIAEAIRTTWFGTEAFRRLPAVCWPIAPHRRSKMSMIGIDCAREGPRHGRITNFRGRCQSSRPTGSARWFAIPAMTFPVISGPSTSPAVDGRASCFDGTTSPGVGLRWHATRGTPGRESRRHAVRKGLHREW